MHPLEKYTFLGSHLKLVLLGDFSWWLARRHAIGLSTSFALRLLSLKPLCILCRQQCLVKQGILRQEGTQEEVLVEKMKLCCRACCAPCEGTFDGRKYYAVTGNMALEYKAFRWDTPHTFCMLGDRNKGSLQHAAQGSLAQAGQDAEAGFPAGQHAAVQHG